MRKGKESAKAKLDYVANKPKKTSNRAGSANNSGCMKAGDVSIKGGK